MSGDFPGGNPRVPPPYEGIQVNFCKNVECGHFGRPASPERQPRGPGARERENDRWLTYPFPDMSEPEKAVCYLTNRGDYGESHLAQLYLKASLHAVDSYFNQVRTRLSPLQRAVHSPSSARRTWYGKQPYDPRMVQKLLDLLRLFHNYCLKSKKDKMTPAMRLGLARAPIDLDEVIYFQR